MLKKLRNRIDQKTGLIQEAKVLLSPNCDVRPTDAIINLLVIHNISLPPGEFGSHAVEQFFLNQLDYEEHAFYQQLKTLKVSAHLFINRDGDMIQFVPFHLRAWHAGNSSFQNKERCNDYSIGIEMEGTDDTPYTKSQYEQLRVVTLELMQCYPNITRDRIVGHSTIAPTRKTDPGPAFDWDYFNRLLDKEI